MSTEAIARLRDHVFYNKAQVMEEGWEVTVSPRKAKWLILPAYENSRPYMRKSDVKRGYAMSKGPFTITPGRKYHGNFTAFWMHFWNNRGLEIVDDSVNALLDSDFAPEISKPRTMTSVRPIGTYNVNSDIIARKKAVQRRVRAKAKSRKVTNEWTRQR